MEHVKAQVRHLLDLLWVNSPASPQVYVHDDIVYAVWLVNNQWIDIEADEEGWRLSAHPAKLTVHEGPIGELPTHESLQEYRDLIEELGTHVTVRAPERLDILL